MKFATLLTVVLEELSFKKNHFFFNLMLPWQQTKLSLVIKHINWVDNQRMIITAKYGLHYFTGFEENAI